MKRKMVVLFFVVAFIFSMTVPVMADVTFSGSGASGTDPFGNSWTFVQSSSGVAWIFGTPGLGAGTRTTGSPTVFTGFEFESTWLVQNTTQTPGGYNEETRFEVESPATLWTRIISADQYTVEFFAPSGAELTGDQYYFFNINLLDPVSTTCGTPFSFTATYKAAAVPEPATLLLLGFGLAGLATLRRKP